MPREYLSKPVSEGLIAKLVSWLGVKETSYCFLGTGWGKHIDFDFDLFAGFGTYSISDSSLSEAISFVEHAKDYVITALSYDVKNELEVLTSNNPDLIDFPDRLIFIPSISFLVRNNALQIGWRNEQYTKSDIEGLFTDIENHRPTKPSIKFGNRGQRLSKSEYISTIHECQNHLQKGDIYQANICQEFHWSAEIENSAAVFFEGFCVNPNPFSVYLKYEEKHCLSWSPERFMTISDSTVLSQPMKGTAARYSNANADSKSKAILEASEKDRRENVMIVDMVRNDLSHFAVPGSVKVPELYKIETFPKVHQMYSTVIAELQTDTPLFQALLKAFPMGSMTGAPKIRAMQIIERLERSKRGIFSGTIGFFTPQASADFNVVIRSLVYNGVDKYLSCHVGGGITAMSDAELEYEECLTKITPVLDLLEKVGKA